VFIIPRKNLSSTEQSLRGTACSGLKICLLPPGEQRPQSVPVQSKSLSHSALAAPFPRGPGVAACPPAADDGVFSLHG